MRYSESESSRNTFTILNSQIADNFQSPENVNSETQCPVTEKIYVPIKALEILLLSIFQASYHS